MDDHQHLLTFYASSFEPSLGPTLHGVSPSIRHQNPSALTFQPRRNPMRGTRFSAKPPPQQPSDSPFRRTSIYDNAGILRTEIVKWDDKTFNLPVVPSPEASKTDKNTSLTRTVEALREQGGQQSWATKVNLLTQRFRISSVLPSAKIHLAALLLPESAAWQNTNSLLPAPSLLTQ